MQAPLRGDACIKPLELASDLERDDSREQRDAFDERRENQRRCLNAASRFRLTRHAFNRLAANATDTEARADNAQTSADEAQSAAVARRFRGNLEQGVHGHEILRTVEIRTAFSPAPLGAARPRGPGLNELLQPLGWIQTLALERFLARALRTTAGGHRLAVPFPIPYSQFPISVAALSNKPD